MPLSATQLCFCSEDKSSRRTTHFEMRLRNSSTGEPSEHPRTFAHFALPPLADGSRLRLCAIAEQGQIVERMIHEFQAARTLVICGGKELSERLCFGRYL
jgi:hypothetical protein